MNKGFVWVLNVLLLNQRLQPAHVGKWSVLLVVCQRFCDGWDSACVVSKERLATSHSDHDRGSIVIDAQATAAGD